MSAISVQPKRLLVVLPSWVGDAVMATPTLRALRQLFPGAHISCLARSTVRPMVDACPWVDRIISIRPRRKGMKLQASSRRRRTFANLAARLRAAEFDTAVLLSNSFRTALLARLADIPRRVGYDRDGRGFLLTDRLLPIREGTRFMPVPTLHYYLGLARYLGAESPDPAMQLFTRPEDDRRADELLRGAGVDPDSDSPIVLLNPGATYGDAKMWYPNRFAAVADELIRQRGARVLVNGSPNERAILDAVHAAAEHAFVDLPKLGGDLTLLKSIVRRCDLMITNDTGPRHVAAAFGVPVVSIFGPTDPRWSEIDFAHERKVRVDVFCGPCQKKTCPLDHRCMTRISPEMVAAEACNLLDAARASKETIR